MAIVELATQPWGYIVDVANNPMPNTTVQIRTLAGANATTYSTIGGTGGSTSDFATNSVGLLERFIDENSYNVTVNGTTRRVEAASGATLVSAESGIGVVLVADTTFTVDASAALYAACQEVDAAGGGVVVVPPGHCKLDVPQGSAPTGTGGGARSVIYLSGFDNVTIKLLDGAILETTLAAAATAASLFEIVNSNTKIVGGKLKGPNYATQDSANANVRPAAVRLTNAVAAKVEGCEITGFGYCGVYLTGGARYCTVKGLYVHDQQGHGIVEDNFPATGSFVSTPPQGNLIVGNTIVNLTTGTGSGAFGIGIDSPGERTWTKVVDNHINTVTLAGIKCNTAECLIASNTILNSDWSGVFYEAKLAGAGSIIRENRIYNCGQFLRGDISDRSPGIWLEADSTHAGTVQCVGNTIVASGKHGIYSFGLIDSTVDHNEIATTSNSGHGIYVTYDTAARDGSSYSHNLIRSTAADGIRVTATGAGVGSTNGLRVNGNTLRAIGTSAINFLALALNQFIGVSCSDNTILNYAVNATGDGINFDVTRGTMDNNTIESGTSVNLRNFVRTTSGLASRIYWRGRFPSGNSSGGGFNDASGQLRNMLDDASGVAIGVAASNGVGTVSHSIDSGAGSIRAGRSLINGRVTQTLASNGAVTIDAALGNLQDITLQANATSSTISFSVGSSGNYVGMELTINWRQDGTGSRTYVWPTNCKFAGAAAPAATTTASRIDAVTFRFDGTSWNEIARSVNVG